MRTWLPLLLTLGLASCGTLREVQPFRHDQDRLFESSPATSPAEHPPPPGISWQAQLAGVRTSPRDALPQKFYELRIDLQQAPGAADWTAEFAQSNLRDDEGQTFRPTQILIDGKQLRRRPGSGRTEEPHVQRFKIEFQVPPGYRFFQMQSIEATWLLLGPGGGRRLVRSTFRN